MKKKLVIALGHKALGTTFPGTEIGGEGFCKGIGKSG